MPATGPGLHSRSRRATSTLHRAFYEQYLGLVPLAGRTSARRRLRDESRSRSHSATSFPATDLASVAQPGIGAAIWLHATDVQAIHDALVADGHTIVSGPIDGPFGRTFTFADPDGYQVTLHDRRLMGQTPPDDHRSPKTAVAAWARA